MPSALPSPESLASTSWNDLLELRRKAGPNKELQNLLAPFEHRAYARETLAAEPSLKNLLGLLVSVPAYSGARSTGILGGRSDPSLEHITQGLIGIGEGVGQGAKSGLAELIELLRSRK